MISRVFVPHLPFGESHDAFLRSLMIFDFVFDIVIPLLPLQHDEERLTVNVG